MAWKKAYHSYQTGISSRKRKVKPINHRIKIFSTSEAPVEVEKQINKWLEINKDIEIINMYQTESGTDDSGFTFTITILYKKDDSYYKK